MFHTMPFGTGWSSAGPSIPTVIALPRPEDVVTLPHTPARLKLYPKIGMPASPMQRMSVFAFCTCWERCGPSGECHANVQDRDSRWLSALGLPLRCPGEVFSVHQQPRAFADRRPLPRAHTWLRSADCCEDSWRLC